MPDAETGFRAGNQGADCRGGPDGSGVSRNGRADLQSSILVYFHSRKSPGHGLVIRGLKIQGKSG